MDTSIYSFLNFDLHEGEEIIIILQFVAGLKT